jgi:uncharacterized CHY-type Zn-finger protein
MNVIKTILALLVVLFSLPFSASAQQDQPVKAPVLEFAVHGIPVYGKPIDNQTRCTHWHSSLDIIAIKFKCCGKYYPCYSCHEETTDHEAIVWPVYEFDQKAILCGVCGTELAIKDYMGCNNVCPKCTSLFNPGCRKHYHLYFETQSDSQKENKSGGK